MLLIRNSKGGELLGASCSQISFNLGNALGAFVGGIPIAHGLTYNYTALPGSIFAFIVLQFCSFFTKDMKSANLLIKSYFNFFAAHFSHIGSA